MVLHNVVSFVGQLDNHAPFLTVAETFDFAARCQLAFGVPFYFISGLAYEAKAFFVYLAILISR